MRESALQDDGIAGAARGCPTTPALEHRVEEGCEGRPLCDGERRAEQQEREDHRKKPPLPARLQEEPQFPEQPLYPPLELASQIASDFRGPQLPV